MFVISKLCYLTVYVIICNMLGYAMFCCATLCCVRLGGGTLKNHPVYQGNLKNLKSICGTYLDPNQPSRVTSSHTIS